MKPNKKERADNLLVQMGFFGTREQAQVALLEGRVLFDGKRITKAGTKVARPQIADVREVPQYVSRGGTKLAKAIEAFNIDIKDKMAIDVGASTGGFTDCLLQCGARSVISIDVGYGQLAWKLRNDPRVRVIERTNIRYFEPSVLDQPADIAVVDVSFISITKIVDNLLLLLKPRSEIVILVKPQFEAGKDLVGKQGVVKDAEVHKNILQDLTRYLRAKRLAPSALAFSPLLGPKGNIEFFLYVKTDGDDQNGITLDLIDGVVSEAHWSLRRANIELSEDQERGNSDPDR
jgi:23S rRNA (cytidine1920-2'-O)/16S rRNA (cytidine1409-2'-O)-methyltransferase